MRQLPTAFANHLKGQATTLCSAWRLTRRDGIVLGFTDHDRDLAFDGTVFSAVSGFSASDVQTELGLSVDGGEVAGAFRAEAISRKKLIEGRFDGARVELFTVNWADTEQRLRMRVFEIGEVVHADGEFRAELRGLAHRLNEVNGRIYSRRCDADLGDRRCRIDLEDPAFRRTGTVETADGMELRVSGLETAEDGFFRQGYLRWEDGANAGLGGEILDHGKDGEGDTLTFWAPPVNPPQPGDSFVVTAGCDKRFETCRTKFSNHLNYQGFPHLPGSDFAYGYADGDTVHDGRPLVTT
ncbi:DUF2163 domain-containing protein [Pararhizobium haloflavum]|uniref:DUF2163 domain-containing protein n=1 Tax=Pararhizobium haloflavum TaxID=2037914 RepID=UPI000C176B36|nr:DUF2163 domain-containing protein [Pararhizobium haloflavum]